MNDPQRPLPLSDVLDIVERRRRRRVRAQRAAGSTLGIAAAGIAGLIVVTLQSDRDALPAAQRPPAASAMATPTPDPPAPSAPPPLDPVYGTPDYLTSVADSVVTGTGSRHDRQLVDADALADAWGLDLYPDAKAIVGKADVVGFDIDPRDPDGDEELVSRFERAGLTDEDAAELAQTWTVDPRTARLFAALLLD
jgi:hypothetical protein